MNKRYRGVIPLAGLILASLACQTLVGGVRDTPVPTSTSTLTPAATRTPRPTATEESAVLLSDDFTDRRWGTGTSDDSAIEYADDALQFIIFADNWFAWSTPNDEAYDDVHIEVTVINNGSDPTTAAGIMCRQQPEESTFYYFAITFAGEYAIARATAGEQDVFLTNDDQWGPSDLIATEASEYRIGADCAGSRLALYVDGQEIDSVSDRTYQSGGVGLFVWSAEEAANTDVAFDDFEMTEAP